MDVEVSVLLIESEDDLRQRLRDLLERQGYAVAEASNGRDGLFQFHVRLPDLVIIDVGLRGPAGGWQVLERIRSMSPVVGVMMIGVTREELPDLYVDDENLETVAEPISRSNCSLARALTRNRLQP